MPVRIQRTASVDLLEPRRLFAATPYARLDANGVLRVFGSDGDDQIEVNPCVQLESANPDEPLLGVSVIVNGTPLLVGRAGVARFVRVYADAGDDAISVLSDLNKPRAYVEAGDGDDSVITDNGDDTLLGQGGNDRLVSERGRDSLNGGGGNDTLVDGGDANTLVGGAGKDTFLLFYNGDRDRILCGPGNDYVTYSLKIEGENEGEDYIDGGDGNDWIEVGGRSTVFGGAGDDRFTSSFGTVTWEGGAGDDTLINARNAADRFSGGDGWDVVDYSARERPVYVEIDAPRPDGARLIPGLGNNQPHWRNNGLFDDGRVAFGETTTGRVDEDGKTYLPGDGQRVAEYAPPDDANYEGTGRLENDRIGDADEVIGGSGDDVFVGNQFANTFVGNAGDDTFFAGGGADNLFGNAGDDRFFTTDTRDAFPRIPAPNAPRFDDEDVIVGGPGDDFARMDTRDQPFLRGVDRREFLAVLSS
jgi:Ca2+-binding RTX toxin-like protein